MAYDFSNVPAEGTIGNRYWRANANPGLVDAYDAQRLEEEGSLQSAFDEEDPFVEETVDNRSAKDKYLEQAESSGVYYGLTRDQRDSYNEAVFTDVDAMAKDDSGNIVIDMANSPYQQWLDSFNTETKTFEIEDPIAFFDEQNPDFTTAAEQNAYLKYGLTPSEFDSIGEGAEAAYSEAVKNLNSLKKEDPAAFESVFNSLTAAPALAYLHDQLKKGAITKEEHAKASLPVLQRESPTTTYFVDNNKVYSYATPDNTGTPREVILTPDNVWNKPAQDPYGNFLNQIGTVSSKPSKDYDVGAISGFVSNPLVNIVASFVPGGQVMLTAIKALSGETLHLSDWVNLAAAGLEYKGTLEGETLAAAEKAADLEVERAIASGAVKTAQDAEKLYQSTLAGIEIAPSV